MIMQYTATPWWTLVSHIAKVIDGGIHIISHQAVTLFALFIFMMVRKENVLTCSLWHVQDKLPHDG